MTANSVLTSKFLLGFSLKDDISIRIYLDVVHDCIQYSHSSRLKWIMQSIHVVPGAEFLQLSLLPFPQGGSMLLV